MSLSHLQELKAVQNKMQDLGSKRHSQAEAHYQRGMEFLERVHREDFADPHLLEDALTGFLEAMKLNRQDIRTYLAAAYIFSLVNAFSKALEYVSAALELDPGNEAAHFFQFVVRSHQSEMSRKPPVASTAQPAAQQASKSTVSADNLTIDYDGLYDQTELYIVKTLQQAMKMPPTPPSGDFQTLAVIRDNLKQYKGIYQHIRSQLDIIDEEIDISELEQRTRPLQQLLKRLETSYQISQSYVDIKKGIADQLSAAAAIEAGLGAGNAAAGLEVQLESILDHCDRLADKLDELDKQQYSIAELEPLYEELLARVEQLREAIDGAG